MEEALREAGLRVTRQRAAIVRVLVEAEDHPDATEVHRRARGIDETVSLATVYRTLSALEEKGVIHRHVFDNATARFETSDAPHHDHIIDVETGEVVEFTSPEIERLQREIARARGYEVVMHRHELYCRKKDSG
jgi:Fur family ferric uptake transcriptional regulator